jgi:hypothetical protein
LKNFIICLIVLCAIVFEAKAQTHVSIGLSSGTMLTSPHLFQIKDRPIGLGANMRIARQGMKQGSFKFVEGGLESFKFKTPSSAKIHDWNYLRLNFGKRSYAISEGYGWYGDVAIGFYGIIPSVFGSRFDKFAPGGGVFFGLGYSKGILDVGVQTHASYSRQGFAFNPFLRVALNLSK